MRALDLFITTFLAVVCGVGFVSVVFMALIYGAALLIVQAVRDLGGLMVAIIAPLVIGLLMGGA